MDRILGLYPKERGFESLHDNKFLVQYLFKKDMTEFTKISFGKAFVGVLMGFLPFVGFGILGVGARYLFKDITIGIFTFFALSILFILLSWIIRHIKKDVKKIRDL